MSALSDLVETLGEALLMEPGEAVGYEQALSDYRSWQFADDERESSELARAERLLRAACDVIEALIEKPYHRVGFADERECHWCSFSSDEASHYEDCPVVFGRDVLARAAAPAPVAPKVEKDER